MLGIAHCTVGSFIIICVKIIWNINCLNLLQVHSNVQVYIVLNCVFLQCFSIETVKETYILFASFEAL